MEFSSPLLLSFCPLLQISIDNTAMPLVSSFYLVLPRRSLTYIFKLDPKRLFQLAESVSRTLDTRVLHCHLVMHSCSELQSRLGGPYQWAFMHLQPWRPLYILYCRFEGVLSSLSLLIEKFGVSSCMADCSNQQFSEYVIKNRLNARITCPANANSKFQLCFLELQLERNKAPRCESLP